MVANKDAFQTIRFEPGLNVVLAERDPSATDRHSRNARGKTTLVSILNFCLGSDLSSFMKPLAEDDWRFALRLDLLGSSVQLVRSCANPRRVLLVGALGTDLPVTLDADGSLSVTDLKSLLGSSLFGLDDEDYATGLSARTLLSYVIRTESPKDPQKIVAQQSAVSSRQHVSYLVGVDHEPIRELANLSKADTALKGFRYAAENELLPSVSSEAELMLLRAELVRERTQIARRIDGFVVLDNPEGTLAEADRLTARLRDLRNESLSDRRLIDLYRESMAGEEEGSQTTPEALEAVYSEVGQSFVGGAARTLREVADFHARLLSNRQDFMRREVQQLRDRESLRLRDIADLEKRRNALMAALEAGGVIEELVALERSVATVDSALARTDQSLAAAREAQQGRVRIRSEKAQVRARVSDDLARARPNLDRLSSTFNGLVQRLYDRGGVISADVDNGGPKYKVAIQPPVSAGVTKMQLFCFDLALMLENVSSRRHPHFLVHDSVVFDGVDSRQVSAALRMVSDLSREYEFQYVCTLNSDAVTSDTRGEDWFSRAIRREVLDTEFGGLLGVRF